MAKKHRVRWTLFAAGALCLLIVAVVIFAPPYAVRYELVHRLQDHGIAATIGHVDANILTGRVSFDQLRGRGPNGQRFQIGRLAVNLDYRPLLHQHIDIDRLNLANARVVVRQSADHGLTVLGLRLFSSAKNRSGTDWGFGIGRARLSNVVVRYHKPQRGDRPAVDQTVTVAEAKVGRFASWRPNQSTPLALRLEINQGRLGLDGRISPLGPRRSAHIQLAAEQFPMPVLAPWARQAGWRELGGIFDADETLDFRYSAKHGAKLRLRGHSAWHNARAVIGGTRLASQRLAWKANVVIRRPRAGRHPTQVEANGKLALDSLDVHHPGRLDLRQTGARWQGQARVTIGAKTTRLAAQGDLSAGQTRLHRGNRLSMSGQHESLHGGLNMTFNGHRPVIHTRGRIKARALKLAIKHSVSFDMHALDWNGQTSTAVARNGTYIRTDGSLLSDQLTFNAPNVMHVVADHTDWRGKMRMRSAAVFSRAATGRFIARDLAVDMLGLPARVTTDRLTFDGHYAAQPNAGHNSLRLGVAGSATSQNLAVVNTAIHAPWLEAMQLEADGITIDSLNSIGLKKVTASGLRVLGDTNTDSALMRAVSMAARQFSLADRAHFSLADLSIADANIHTRRDASGMGVISDFLRSTSGHSGQSGSGSPASHTRRPPTTLAIDHLHLSGPRLAFVDTTTTPSVRIIGHNLDFKLDHLNTASPDQGANYRLSADLGAYGHLDSLGTIAPLAPGGPNMQLRAWLRSLALGPMSGYLNAAMGRQIANGAIDGTLNLAATKGDLDGSLDATIANFRLANSQSQKTRIAFAISMNTALKLLRGQDDLIKFKTKILGNVTKPYFSIDNLIREAVLAGLRTALFSDFSPIGLLNKAKTKFLNLFRSVEDYPVFFRPGKHYVRPEDRRYMQLLARAMAAHPDWTLQITGRTAPADVKKLGLSGTAASVRRLVQKQLAHQRADAIRDYLVARGANPAQIRTAPPTVTDNPNTRPAVTFSLNK